MSSNNETTVRLTDQEIIQNELIRRGFFDTAETFARQCLHYETSKNAQPELEDGEEK